MNQTSNQEGNEKSWHFETQCLLKPKLLEKKNNKMSSISVTDTELLNNQVWYLDKGWLVHLNQAHCVV